MASRKAGAVCLLLWWLWLLLSSTQVVSVGALFLKHSVCRRSFLVVKLFDGKELYSGKVGSVECAAVL